MPIKLKPVEVGQSVWVTSLPTWGANETRNLGEFIVSRVNGSSFYAYPVEDPDSYHRRFDRRSWRYRTGLGDVWAAFETSTEFLEIQKKAKEKNDLKDKLKGQIELFNMAQLRRLEKYLFDLKGAKR